MKQVSTSSAPQLPVRLVPAAAPTLDTVVRGVRDGERWATDWLWEQYAPMVFRLVERTLGPNGEAEDVTQEVFLRVYSRLGTLNDPSALRSFVYSVTVRILKWELRRRRVRRFLTLSSGELPEVATPGPDQEARQILRRFYAALARLSAEERLLFSLRHLEKLTIKEVADSLDVSTATVKRRLSVVGQKVSALVAGDPALSSYLEQTEGAHADPA